MKSVDFLKALGGVVAMVVACHAFAQASDSTSTGTTATAPAANSKTAKQENRALGKKVRSALAKAQGLDVSNINVRARGGAVTLTGTAPDNNQIQQAGEVAKGVAGVTSVSNKINVQQQ
ncbi:BON domain-containing protein [Burkholderia sp. YR290]|uniref:BON domain-containing protein n=1 Tax=Paraburkholderia hospita TaxID=169430 RepID=UPI0009A6A260|nr:BON domain-containing protein [Paraburkholderia hospita]SKC62539.1 BON domain-containing protein [Paraburkholderia hospita]SOE63749.1 BON domain-containing protein [Burkholderia sp. YR290]